MPRTISDAEDAYYRGRDQVAGFAESVFNDPQLNKEAKRLIKKKYPNLQIPDLELEDKIEQRFAEDDKRRDERAQAEREEAENKAWQEQRSRVKEEYGFTDEGMGELEKLMVEKKIGDYEVAASYKAARDPKPSEPDFDSYRWNHEKAPGFAEIAKDPEGWGRGEIMKALRADQEREKLPWPNYPRR